MTAAEVLPVRSTDRFLLELRPLPEPVDGRTHEWVRVAVVGKRLTAELSPLDWLKSRELRQIEDPIEQAIAAFKGASLVVYHDGSAIYRVGDEGTPPIPEVYVYPLVGKLASICAVGPDPFAAAPAESSP